MEIVLMPLRMRKLRHREAAEPTQGLTVKEAAQLVRDHIPTLVSSHSTPNSLPCIS